MALQLAATCGATCNATIARSNQFKQWIEKSSTAQSAVSAQLIFESSALLSVAAAFIVIWPLCAYINNKAQIFLKHTLKKLSSKAVEDGLSSSEQSVTASSVTSKNRKRELVGEALLEATVQRRRIVAACLVIVVTFIPRCVYSVFSAYGSINTAFNSACAQCGSCQNNHSLINTWLGLTPEILLIVVACSEPIALSVCLWCMITPRERCILRFGSVSEGNAIVALSLLRQGLNIDFQQADLLQPSVAAFTESQPAHKLSEWKTSK
jgi:hypothetical protein